MLTPDSLRLIKHMMASQGLSLEEATDEAMNALSAGFARTAAHLGLPLQSAASMLHQPKTVDPDDPPALRLLGEQLHSLQLVGSGFRPGRPSTWDIRAVGYPVIIAPDSRRFVHVAHVVLYPDDAMPTQSMISQATKRSSNGQAQFTITLKKARDVAFLVLLSEKRVWCLTREYLEAVAEHIAKGGRVPGFTASNDRVQISFAKASNAYEISQVIHVDTGWGPL